MKKKMSSALTIIVGLLVAIGPQIIFPVCEVHKEMVMRCHYVAQMCIGFGIAIVALGMLTFFSHSHLLNKGVFLAQILFGALVIATPTLLIKVCESPMMRCHSKTRPILVLLGVGLIIINLISIVIIKEDRHAK